jgi:hypothetical protein
MANRTQTTTSAIEVAPAEAASAPIVLRLTEAAADKKVKWDDAVIDNEGMGKRSSKSEF